MKRPRVANPVKARRARWLTLTGYFGLLALILCWFTWLAPPERVPRVLPLAALALPLLLPLRGILHARRYTHQWVGFLALPYFIVGVDTAWNRIGLERTLALLMILFSLLLLIGASLYARHTPTPPEQRKDSIKHP